MNRHQRLLRPATSQHHAVLVAVNTAARRVPRWPAASVDRHCARRLRGGMAGTEKRPQAEQRNI